MKEKKSTLALIGFVIVSLAIILSSTSCTPKPQLIAPINVFYVSVSGSDANPGTHTQPFKTFAHAFGAMRAGDELQIFGGTYTEQLTVSISGTASAPISIRSVAGETVVLDAAGARDEPLQIEANRSYINVSDLEVKRATSTCVIVRGKNITLSGLDVHDCREFGFRLLGQNITVENSVCRDSVLENQGGGNTSGGWGACLRSGPGSADLVIRNNHVFHNWGEGIIVGQVAGAQVYGNHVFDNFSQNIYIGNAFDVDAYSNIVHSTDPTYYRSGQPANGITTSEESISAAWGAQLHNIRVYNNLIFGAKTGMGFTYKELSDGGCANCLFAFNTLVNTGGIRIIDGPKNDVRIQNNIITGGGAIVLTAGATQDHNVFGDVGLQPDLILLAIDDPNGYTTHSPLIVGMGVDSGIRLDFFGNPRGPSYDVGAIQVSGGADVTLTSSLIPTTSKTSTPSQVPSVTSTSLPPTQTLTVPPSATATKIPTLTATFAPTRTRTPTPRYTRTPTPTRTPECHYFRSIKRRVCIP